MSMSRKSLLFRAGMPVGMIAFTLLLGACTAGGSQHQAIKNNLTPELISADQRPVDLDNMTAFTWNTESRFFWNDLARAAYTDRPNRLVPFPVPH